MTTSTDVAIIGGGVSGLACALRLRSLEPSLRIKLLEAEPQLGGKIRGEAVRGCIVDGGPDLCLSSRLVSTAAYNSLGLASKTIPVNPRSLPTFRRSGNRMAELADIIGDGLVTFRYGMHELIRVMTEALDSVDIHRSVQVTAIERTGDDFLVTTDVPGTVTARAVVAAIPSSALATAVRGLSPALAAALSGIRYDPMTTVTAGFAARKVQHPLRGTGYISGDAMPGGVSASTWTSSKIPSRCSEKVVLIRGFCRSSDAEAARSLVLDELRSVLGITADPIFTRAFSWAEALPVYSPDHGATVSRIESEARALGAFAIAGAVLHGIGVGDCIASGERAAELVTAAWRRDSPTIRS